MARVLTAAQFRSACERETEEVWLAIAEIAQAGISTIRLVNDGASLTHNGDVYQPFPFAVVLAPDVEDELPRGRMVVCVVDRSVTAAIRTMTGAPTITIRIVLQSAPDVVVAGPFQFEARVIPYTTTIASIPLSPEGILEATYPGIVFTPARFPGLFAEAT